MIYETFANRYKGWGQVPPKNAIVINIMKSNGHILAPSEQLLTDWQTRKKKSSSSYGMTWQDYRERFLREMESPEVKEEIQEIAALSRFKDVYLFCSCWNDRRECHRFIVLELVKEAMRQNINDELIIHKLFVRTLKHDYNLQIKENKIDYFSTFGLYGNFVHARGIFLFNSHLAFIFLDTIANEFDKMCYWHEEGDNFDKECFEYIVIEEIIRTDFHEFLHYFVSENKIINENPISISKPGTPSKRCVISKITDKINIEVTLSIEVKELLSCQGAG